MPSSSSSILLALQAALAGLAAGTYGAQLLVAGDAPDSVVVPVQLDIVTGVGETEPVPTAFALRQNYPNPFNPSTRLAFDVPVTSRVTLTVYDVLGRAVATPTDGIFEPGRYVAVWDARGAATGVYFARMETPAFVGVRKLLLMK